MLGLDPANGRVHYQTMSEGNSIVAGPAVAAGRIIVITLAASNPRTVTSTVRTAWTFTPDLKGPVPWEFPHGAHPHTIMASGDIVVASSDQGTWAVDARTRRGLWAKDLPPQTEVEGVRGKAVIAQDFHITNEQEFIGYDIVTGRQIWRNNPPEFSDYARGDEFHVGIADGTLFAAAHTTSRS